MCVCVCVCVCVCACVCVCVCVCVDVWMFVCVCELMTSIASQKNGMTSIYGANHFTTATNRIITCYNCTCSQVGPGNLHT